MKKILVIEDVEFNRDLIVQLLEDRYEVVTAVDGQQGLECARSGHPDLILMDLSLPGLDGWEVTRRIKADPSFRHIPIIAVSAHAMTGDEQLARDSGCDDYISKPIDEEILFAKLQKFLGES
jgi:CheY-like chemotaxis protein